MMSRLIILFMALCLGSVLGGVVQSAGQDHQHPPADVEIHELFYSNWMRPDMPTVSCCDMRDCYPTEVRQEDGVWYARQRETGNYVRVPEDKIERERDSPDGRNHVCMSPTGHVFCFSLGGGI